MARRRTPATTPEASENRMISLAIKQAEKQMEEGTASAQIIVHYLKLASTKNRLEEQRIRKEIELSSAKTAMLESQKRSEELFDRAIKAMRGYQGLDDRDDEYDDKYY